MNSYQKTTKKIDQVDSQIEANRLRDSEARQRLAAAERAVEDHESALNKALLNADPKKISEIEGDISRLRSEVLKRDSLLLDALSTELENLEAEKEVLQREADSFFAKNANKVMAQLVGEFDAHAREVIRYSKRLIAIHQLLREHGHGEIFRQTIGPATDVLGTFRVPVIKGFKLSDFNARTHLYVGGVFEEMRRAIEEA